MNISKLCSFLPSDTAEGIFLPGAHSPTAADMRPGPPSRPRTRRPPACPRNTGAWLRLPPSAAPTASVRNSSNPATREQSPEERTGNRQQQFPVVPRGLRVPRGRARRKWAHVTCRTSVYVSGKGVVPATAGLRWRAAREPVEAAVGLQEDVTKYFSDFPSAGERSIEFQGCSETHGWSEAVQIPEKTVSFSADGL